MQDILGKVMDSKQIQIDEIQFKSLLEALNQTDWINIFFQVLLVLLAAGSGYFFQNLFAKAGERESFIKESNKLNEAVIYLSSIVESIALHLDRLVLPAHDSEQQTLAGLQEISQNPQEPITINIQNMSIRPIEVAKEESFLSKIYHVGKYGSTIQVFYRMQTEMRQFNDICEERNFLIKRVHERSAEPHTRKENIARHSEIFQRTYSLILSGESILDAALFLSTATEEISKEIKNELKEKGIKKVNIFKIEKNDLNEKLRLRLRNMVDENPYWKDRLLHIPREQK